MRGSGETKSDTLQYANLKFKDKNSSAWQHAPQTICNYSNSTLHHSQQPSLEKDSTLLQHHTSAKVQHYHGGGGGGGEGGQR